MSVSRRKRKVPGTTGHWSDNQKIEAVTTWLATGNMALTAAALGIPHITIRQWKAKPWWNEMVDSIRSEENLQLDAKLSKVVNKSVDALLDRVENGDFQYDQKKGVMVRKPVNARDASKITTEIIDRRELLQGKKQVKQDSTKLIEDRLLKLADEFTRFARAKEVVGEAKIING
jgi:hypothetical protein